MTQTPDPNAPDPNQPEDTSPLPPAPPPPPHGDPVTGHGEQWGQEAPPPPPGYDPSQQQPSYGQQPAQPQYEQPQYQQPQYEQPQYQQPGYPQQGYQQGSVAAPYGIHPGTGIPYSDKSKLAAGLLNIFVAGVGRMYIGQVGLGVAQLLVTIFTCGIGALWPIIDGIMILTKDDAKDAQGRILKS